MHTYRQLGKFAALEDLGLTSQGATADMFVQAVQQDTSDVERENQDQANVDPAKPVHWSGQSNLSAGDAGTRAHELGLPRSGAV